MGNAFGESPCVIPTERVPLVPRPSSPVTRNMNLNSRFPSSRTRISGERSSRSSDTRVYLLSSWSNGRVLFQDPATGVVERTKEGFSTNGVATRLTFATQVSASKFAVGSVDRYLRVCDISSSRCWKFPRSCSAFCVDSLQNGRLVSGYLNGEVVIWDILALKSREALQSVLSGHTGLIWCVRRLDKGGNRVVSASRDRMCRIWDLVTGKCLRILPEHKGPVMGLATVFEGRSPLIFSGASHSGRTVHVWDERQEDSIAHTHCSNPINALEVASGNNKALVVACLDGNISRLDLRWWEESEENLSESHRWTTGHSGAVFGCVAITVPGHEEDVIVTSSESGPIDGWNWGASREWTFSDSPHQGFGVHPFEMTPGCFESDVACTCSCGIGVRRRVKPVSVDEGREILKNRQERQRRLREGECEQSLVKLERQDRERERGNWSRRRRKGHEDRRKTRKHLKKLRKAIVERKKDTAEYYDSQKRDVDAWIKRVRRRWDKSYLGLAKAERLSLNVGEVEIQDEKIQLGSGTHANVSIGVARIGGLRMRVALKKVPLESVTARAAEAEVEMLMELDHENIVRCLGCTYSLDGAILYQVLELCDASLSPVPDPMSQREKFGCFLQIAAGMCYLHDEAQLIHYDLKPENVLIDGGRMKIADFDLSVRASDESFSKAGVRGTPPFMAPKQEYFLPEFQKRKKIDVYSFAILIWEIWTGKKAWASLRRRCGDDTLLQKKIWRSELRAGLDGMPLAIQSLCSRCWNQDLELRPDFAEVKAALLRLLEFADTEGGGDYLEREYPFDNDCEEEEGEVMEQEEC